MKKSIKDQTISILMAASMLTFMACGSDDDDDSRPSTQAEQQQTEGSYRVVLTPINETVSGNVSGTGTFIIEGDEVNMQMSVNGAPASTEHGQHIHMGTACATQADDVNGDGFVDAVEAQPRVGNIIIPLDGNLDSQESGDDEFPTADALGNYEWNESTSLTLMLADLRAPDLNTGDATTKLPLGEELNLEGKVVEVHGVSASTVLPDSVSSIEGLPAQATLPIACGVIQRVGAETGGTATGGTATGGTATGGTATGGTATGGTATGGTATGGTATGGTATGGTTVGGTTVGGTTVGGTTGF